MIKNNFLIVSSVLIFTIFVNTSHSSDSERELVDFAKSLSATNDSGFDLVDVLEKNKIKNACERHYARLDRNTEKLPQESLTNPEHVSDMLMCGKFLFFSADFDSNVAFPANIIKSGLKIFKDQTGPAFSNYGFIPQPNGPFPVGIETAAGNPWGFAGFITGKPMTITCAACHFGKLDDGRYMVGKANDELEFGKFNAFLMFSTWLANNKKGDREIWPQDISNYYRDMLDTLESSWSPSRALFDSVRLISWTWFSDSFYKLVGLSVPTSAELSSYIVERKGISYASSPLLPVTKHIEGELQGVPFFLSSPNLWDITNFPGDVDNGLAKPLSTFIPTNDLNDFIKAAYIFQTGNQNFSSPKFVDPLALYMRTLTGPERTVADYDSNFASNGVELFNSNCSSCHNGPTGESLDAIDPLITNSPNVLVDPFVNYEPIHDLSEKAYSAYFDVLGPIAPQGGIRSRSLAYMGIRHNLMINGSVDDIEHAFCLSKPRGDITEGVLRNDIHMDLCSDYSEQEKMELVEYFKSL